MVHVFPQREHLAEVVEFGDIKIGNFSALFVVSKRHDWLQTRVIRHGVTIVVQAHAVIAHAVHRRNIALVLRGTGCNECIPILDADVWPIGYHEENVIVITALVACPNRETQIVANKQENLHTLILRLRSSPAQ